MIPSNKLAHDRSDRTFSPYPVSCRPQNTYVLAANVACLNAVRFSPILAECSALHNLCNFKVFSHLTQLIAVSKISFHINQILGKFYCHKGLRTRKAFDFNQILKRTRLHISHSTLYIFQ